VELKLKVVKVDYYSIMGASPKSLSFLTAHSMLWPITELYYNLLADSRPGFLSGASPVGLKAYERVGFQNVNLLCDWLSRYDVAL